MKSISIEFVNEEYLNKSIEWFDAEPLISCSELDFVNEITIVDIYDCCKRTIQKIKEYGKQNKEGIVRITTI